MQLWAVVVPVARLTTKLTNRVRLQRGDRWPKLPKGDRPITQTEDSRFVSVIATFPFTRPFFISYQCPSFLIYLCSCLGWRGLEEKTGATRDDRETS